MFIISLTYKKPLEEVDFHLSAHVEYLETQCRASNLLASGRKIPRTGGIILSDVETRERLDEILKQDPFYKSQVADYEVTEFVPSMTCPELAFLKK
jgi:uncharacterized protein YciI